MPEIDRKQRIVLVHDPKEEMFLGVLHPDAALFADYLDVREANREHRHFQHVMTKCGFDVRTVRDTMTAGTMDGRGRPVQGDALEELRAFAAQFLEYDGYDTVDPAAQRRYKEEVLRKAHPLDLVGIVLNRPKIILHATSSNTGFSADYVMRPMMNLLFMRDSMINTPRGAVIGRLHSPQRQGERLVGEFCLRKFGTEPVFRIPDATYLEGGDYVLSGS
ncbi:MAG: arginine deiminase family protein, partial [Rikenellaceae bacterium]|nr:arginine deiminase family protein [Rikenellaceae bacterium]